MTATNDVGTGDEPLDRLLRSLPQALEPRQDLWPAVEARLEAAPPRARRGWYWQAAAAVLLVTASALLTMTWMRRAEVPSAQMPAESGASARATPAAFGPAHALSPEYDAARRQLTAMLQQRMAQMPPSARRKLETNLAQLRHAAAEINAALDEAPGDPLLEELLLNTYQDELAVLAAVNQLTSTTNPAGTTADAKRMQL